MKIVGIRELKDRLSDYVRAVRRGARILVSRHGEIVAEMRTAYGTTAPEDLEPGLRRLAEEGLLRPGLPREPRPVPVPDPLVPEGTAGRLLDEERGGR